jgi:hypothetical protein
MKFLRLLWLRYWYGFELTLAYLASHTHEGDVQAEHESAAEEVARLYWRETIN